ncbi:MAG: hypothetical protein AAGG51_30115 [Cyanobacteria bacterium P01_G01_bin.54]
MEAELKNTLVELKDLIQHLSISDRWILLKWLVELLQKEPQASPTEKKRINLNKVNQICTQIRSLPLLNDRTPEEIIGYDEFGGLGS